MKTTSIFILLFISCLTFGQVDFYKTVRGAASSQNGRGPQGARATNRSVFLITQAEMSSEGWVTSDIISGLGFNIIGPQNIATTGTITVYLENTTNTTNTKSTSWTTAITGMTTVSAGAITVPNTVGELNIVFSGGSPFTYTGGGLYVAFEYLNTTNPVATAVNTMQSNNILPNSILSNMTISTTPSDTLTPSSFRPTVSLGFIGTTNCARPRNVNYYLTTSTATGATINFQNTSNNNVEIQYAPLGTVITSGTTSTTTTGSYTFSGLLANTIYAYRVRTNCGSDYSVWSDIEYFNTTYSPANILYNTSFETPRIKLIGWNIPNQSFVVGQGDWSTGVFGLGPLVQDGNYSIYSVSSNFATSNNYLFSRAINLTSGVNYTINFYVSNNVQNGSTGTTSYELRVGNAPTTAAQTTVVGSETGFNSAPFVLKTFSFTPTSTGNYYFSLVNNSPLNATGQHAVIVDNFSIFDPLSTNEFNKNGFSIYPNPVGEYLKIQNNLNTKINSIEIYDLNGKLIKQVNSNLENINVSDISSGNYIVNINSEAGNKVLKLIKE